MKKTLLMLLSMLLCFQLTSCGLMIENTVQENNNLAAENVSNIFSCADGSTLEIALTNGQGSVFSSVDDKFTTKLDVSDRSVYGNALSSITRAKLLTENGKLNPNGWLKPTLAFSSSVQNGTGTIIGSVQDITANAPGT